MASRLRLAITAIVAAVGLGALPWTQGADISDREEILGRQQIRAELATAIAGGHLSPSAQYQVMMDARAVLRPEDLPGVQRTLERLASGEAPAGRQPRRLDAEVTAEVPPPAGPGAEPAQTSQTSPEVIAPGVIAGNEAPAEACQPYCDGPYCCPGDGWQPRPRWPRLSAMCVEASTTIDGFKGAMDPLDTNGNFGLGVGVNVGMPLFPRLGIGFQAGTKEIVSDFSGTVFTNSDARTQNFTTVGFFQRIPACRNSSLDWGFVYDWLFEDYYDKFQFGQWRAKLAWEMNPWNEVGVWAAMCNHTAIGTIDLTPIGGGLTEVAFRPTNQGSVYWRHTWCNDADLTFRLGVAEKPNDMVFGAETRVPISPRLSVIGSFSYLVPRDPGGPLGQTEENWNVSVGLQFTPGGIGRCLRNRFAPLFGVADNGTFAVRETE